MVSYSISWPQPTAVERGLNLIFPPRCVSCGAWGHWLCDDCVARVSAPSSELGVLRGRRLPAARFVDERGALVSYLSSVAWVCAHSGPLRDAVHALKYGGLRVLAGPLGQILAQGWRQRGIQIGAVVGVPLHALRLRRRGYNQAALLAAALAAELGVPYREDALVRLRRTRTQVGLGPDERWRNVHGAFAACGPGLGDSPVLLVDDVMTTGATLEACAQALQGAGTGDVHALTLTRMATRHKPG